MTARVRRGFVIIGLIAAAVTIAGSSVDAQAPATDSAVCGTAFPTYHRDPVSASETTLADLAIPMSDGTVLRADVHLPNGVAGPFPTVLTITGYGKQGVAAFLGGGGGGLARYGYATMTVDERGTGSSGGLWDSWGDRTKADYAEVLDWIVAQPWSDGRIGVTGASYMGITSIFAAATRHPAVKAVFATVPMADAYRDIVFAGGQVNVAFIPLWMGLVTGLGLVPGPDLGAIVDHILGLTSFQLPTIAEAVLGGASTDDGPFWRGRSPIEVADDVRVPTFLVGGLDDLFQRGTPMLYERLADHTDARLLIGPWAHVAGATGAGLPRDGVPSLGDLTLQWFDEHVMGLDTGADCIPPVTQFIRGVDHYESAPSWPVPGLTASRWHLRGDGSLSSSPPAAAEPSRTYLQLPLNGLCSRSTNQWLIGLLDGTTCAVDNRLDELTALTWTSPVFDRPMRINGPIEADLWLRTMLGSDAVTSVAISDVAPDGTSRGLSNGLLVASNRAVDPARSRMLDGQSIQPWHPFTDAASAPVTPGQPTFVPIEVFPTSAEIPAGHQLRVTVAAYDVPHALPPLPQALATLAGPVEVLSDPAHPSSIVVPVVASSSSPEVPEVPSTPEAPESPGAPPSPNGAGTGGTLPTTGAELPLAIAALLLAAALVVRRATAAHASG